MSQITNVTIEATAYDDAQDFLDDAETNQNAAHAQIDLVVADLKAVQQRLEELAAGVADALDDVSSTIETLHGELDQVVDEVSDATCNLQSARSSMTEDQPAEAAPTVVQATGTAVLHAVG